MLSTHVFSGGSKGGARDVPSWGSKFFQFHAVFGKFWQNRMLAPPLGSWCPLLGEILDPPQVLITSDFQILIKSCSIESRNYPSPRSEVVHETKFSLKIFYSTHVHVCRFTRGLCTFPGDRCDGFADCTDLSDEQGCGCPSGFFQ